MAQRKPNKKIPIELARSLSEKILAAATRDGDCLIRTTYRNGNGYTSAHGPMVNGRREVYLAHRVVVVARDEAQIDSDLTVDHVCEIPSCVNPDHLRVMPLKANVLRSAKNPAAINARKTHCKRGHEFTAANTYNPPSNPCFRNCRECQRIRQAEFDARKRAAA